jgi:hypothetical protein
MLEKKATYKTAEKIEPPIRKVYATLQRVIKGCG